LLCGIDLGSRNVKIALMEQGVLKDFLKFDTIEFYRNFGRKENDQLVIDFERIGLKDITEAVSTGYGRNTLNLKDATNIPELKAHMLGANFQTGQQDYTLLDLGGQDSKIIKVRKGKMVDFLTNDKCAASSGRYLENMAAVLGISLEELSKHYKEPVDLDSTCAVFGESELIGKILEGYSIEELCAGVNYTIFKRVQPLLRQLGSERLIFTGGVALNSALAEIITMKTDMEIIIPKHPQFNGAIGCCIQAAGLKGGS